MSYRSKTNHHEKLSDFNHRPFLFSCSQQESDVIRIDFNTIYEDGSRGFLVFYPIAGMNEQLFIDGMPRNILIDPSGKIIEMNIYPSRLLERVDEY